MPDPANNQTVITAPEKPVEGDAAAAKATADAAAAKAAADAAAAGGTPPATDADKKAAAEAAAKKEAEDKAKDPNKDKAKKDGAPEKYEPFKMPEGIKVDEAALGKFTPIAQELGLTQEGAQKLMDLWVEARTNDIKGSNETWSKMRSEWRDKAKADPVFGGAKFDESVGFAKKAIDALSQVEDGKGGATTDPGLREALEITGSGDHPAIVRAFATIGKLLSEDKIVFKGAGAPNTPASKPAADRMYPNQGKQ
jgi:hypothetical protein